MELKNSLKKIDDIENNGNIPNKKKKKITKRINTKIYNLIPLKINLLDNIDISLKNKILYPISIIAKIIVKLKMNF